MTINQVGKAKVVGVMVEVEGHGVGLAVLSDVQKKLLTGALINVAGGQYLKITTPIPAKLQTRGA